MSGKVVGLAFDVGRESGLSATQRYVLVAYSDNADHNGKCWPDKPEIVEKTGLSRASVYRAFNSLVEAGYLIEGTDERGRECVFVSIGDLSHSETPRLRVRQEVSQGEISASQGETGSSHGETPYIDEPSRTVIEPTTDGDRDPIESLFDFWKSQTGRNGHTRLTAERRRAIKARLAEGYSIEEIRTAIANVAASPFHQGDKSAGNRSGRRQDDLTLICRDGAHLESYRDMPPLAGAPRPGSTGPVTPSGKATEAWKAASTLLEQRIESAGFDVWIAPLEAAGEREGELVLLDPDDHRAGWVDKRYAQLVASAIAEVSDFTGFQICDQVELDGAAV